MVKKKKKTQLSQNIPSQSFLIVQFSSVKYINIVVQQISWTFSSYTPETLYLLNNSSFKYQNPQQLGEYVEAWKYYIKMQQIKFASSLDHKLIS